jgi:hypothetical protein
MPANKRTVITQAFFLLSGPTFERASITRYLLGSCV